MCTETRFLVQNTDDSSSELTVEWAWRLNLCICVTQTFKFGHRSIFPWQKVTCLALLVEPKRKEGVFRALCNLLLRAKIKLSQSRLIYYQSFFFYSGARKWTLTSSAQQLKQHTDVTQSSAGVAFTSLLMLFVFTSLHTLIQPNTKIKPWWVRHRSVCEHAYLYRLYLEEVAAGSRSKRLLF